MRRWVVLTLVLSCAVAGCGGGGSISAEDAASLVLHQSDLPKGFSSFYNGPIVRLDTSGTIRSNPQRYGRKGGWIARYRRAGGPATRGPLVVESRVDVFGGAGGAKNDLAAYRHVFGRVIGRSGKDARFIRVRPLGEGRVAMTLVQRALRPVRFYYIAWRVGNATASVAVDGFSGRLSKAEAVALARAQERRMKAT